MVDAPATLLIGEGPGTVPSEVTVRGMLVAGSLSKGDCDVSVLM